MDMSKYREMFLNETREHLDNMNRLIVALEKQPGDRDGINTLFREAHSVKGMAASMGYQQITAVAHNLEDFLDRFRAEGDLPAIAFDHLLAGADLLEQLLEDIAAERPERSAAPFLQGEGEPLELELEPTAGSETAGEPLRFIVTLDRQAVAPAARALLVINECRELGELIDCSPSLLEITRGGPLQTLTLELQTTLSFGEVEQRLARMQDVDGIEPQPSAAAAAMPQRRREDLEQTVRVKTELLDQFINLTGELITNRYILQNASRQQDWTALDSGLNQLARLVGDLHHQVLQVRMMPLQSITGRLPRLMRELCQSLGKQIELEICGEEIELDRAILEKLSDPLVHLLRNAADHGIETSGKVTLRAWREKDLVLLELVDDGRGLDVELIRAKAVERGVVKAAQAKQLSDQEVLMLICQPGFSTRDTVSETSGRGVGMDIVKAAVESIGGILELSSPASGGTRVLLKLPLSVAIIRVLLVQVAGELIALPITRVVRTLELPRAALQRSGRQLVVSFEGEALPLLSLRKILHRDQRVSGSTVAVVVTEIRGRRVGLVVDQLLGQQEVFVKSLQFPLNRITGLAGATVLGSGQVVFVLDPQGLLETARPVSEVDNE